jgi:tetratricopeptide (TPR) repeat protein
MKLLYPCIVLAVAVLASFGCAKKKEVSTIDRKKAESWVSEAQFALTIRDYPRAEGLYVQATAACPDDGGYWVGLGTTRARQGQRDGARAAYQSALRVYEAKLGNSKTDSEAALQQVYVLALLGRVDEARSLQTKLQARFPDNREVRLFVENKQLDRMLTDPRFKEIAL